MQSVIASKRETGNRAPQRSAARLSPLETEVIDLFVQLSRAIGQPKSLGEIYGLLFISAQPMAMDDLIERIQLSKGSASQGLKFLHSVGAVKMIYVAGDRRTHYQAVAELRNLLARFLRDHILPQLDGGQERLKRIAATARQLPAEEHSRVNARISMLQSWERKGRRFLPLVVKMMT
jgi:DNA-binding transcriptional regulator GbsR (MarR family)